MAKKLKTTPILDGGYLVVGVVPGPCGSKIGMVDLSKINTATAERLLAVGFPYLKRAPEPKPARKRRSATTKENP